MNTNDKIEVTGATEEKKTPEEIALAGAANFLKDCTDAEVEVLWEMSTLQITSLALEKARRMGVEDPKVLVVVTEGNRVADQGNWFKKPSGDAN